jgi:hypothetical protein
VCDTTAMTGVLSQMGLGICSRHARRLKAEAVRWRAMRALLLVSGPGSGHDPTRGAQITRQGLSSQERGGQKQLECGSDDKDDRAPSAKLGSHHYPS